MTLPPASSVQQDNNTQCSNHSGILWTLSVIPCGKGICGHRWEGKTGALLSNYTNRHSPDTTELCMVAITLPPHKCQLFRSGFLQVWFSDHFINHQRALNRKIPGPTLSLLNQKQGGGMGSVYILSDLYSCFWCPSKFEMYYCGSATNTH